MKVSDPRGAGRSDPGGIALKLFHGGQKPSRVCKSFSLFPEMILHLLGKPSRPGIASQALVPSHTLISFQPEPFPFKEETMFSRKVVSLLLLALVALGVSATLQPLLSLKVPVLVADGGAPPAPPIPLPPMSNIAA